MRGVDGSRRALLAALAGAALLLAGCASVRPADTILVVGDSLSAGYGLKPGTGWAWLLVPRLLAEQLPAKVVNVSVSGETTVTGRSKIEGLVAQHKPTVVVIELGADDSFDGVRLATIESDLRFMVRTAQQAGARVLLIGVKVPSRYGSAYEAEFARVFSSVAASTGSALVPNLLDRVANAPDVAQLFQADNTHPNEQAQPILLANVWPELRKLLR
jgi:acyl-CoA thioesterase-1